METCLLQCLICSWLFKYRWGFFLFSCELCSYASSSYPCVAFQKTHWNKKPKTFLSLSSPNLHAINHYSSCQNDGIIHWISNICRKAIYYRRPAKKCLSKLFCSIQLLLSNTCTLIQRIHDDCRKSFSISLQCWTKIRRLKSLYVW